MDTDIQTVDNGILPGQVTIIPVIEEYVTIGKEVKETGRIRIDKRVSEREEMVDISLSRDEHIIEHIPRNIYVDTIPVMRQEGNTIIIPVLEEVIVRRTLLVEEIRITKNTVQTSEQQSIILHKEIVTVKHIH